MQTEGKVRERQKTPCNLSHTHTNSHTHTLSLSLKRTHTHAHSHTHTHTHTLPHLRSFLNADWLEIGLRIEKKHRQLMVGLLYPSMSDMYMFNCSQSRNVCGCVFLTNVLDVFMNTSEGTYFSRLRLRPQMDGLRLPRYALHTRRVFF